MSIPNSKIFIYPEGNLITSVKSVNDIQVGGRRHAGIIQ